MSKSLRKYAAALVFGALGMLWIACHSEQGIRIPLEGPWYFRYDPEQTGIDKGYFRADSGLGDWELVKIPHRFAGDYDGWGWYAVRFRLPAHLRNKQVALVVEGVDDRASVYLDGKQVREQWLANMPFYFVLKGGDSKITHRIVLLVKDTGGAGGLIGRVYLQTFEDEENLLKTEYHNRKAIPPPEWLGDGVLYELYVRAFSEKGDFRSVISELPAIRDLGVSCIWLMPIFPVGEEKRKGALGSPYAIKDYKDVNPEFGSREDFSDLVAAIHQNGMKVILDIACNHTAWDNPLIYEHPEWYTRDSGGRIISPNSDWTDVADLDYSNQNLREYMWSVLEYWVRDYDVDGYRLDVAELVPMDFWEKAYKRLRHIKPDILMLAEGAEPELHLSGFQVTYAWNIYWTFYQIFRNDVPAYVLGEVMDLERRRFPSGAVRMRFAENHDQERSPAFFGRRAAKVADVLIFTLPGIPLIYAGQEYGETLKPSLFEKTELRRSDAGEMYAFFKILGEVRKNSRGLREGEYIPVDNSQPQRVYSFMRKTDGERILVACNMGEETSTVDFRIGARFLNLAGIRIKLSYGATILEEENRIKLKSYGWIIAEI